MPYTMATYASEVMQRLARYDVAKHVDHGMLEVVINTARLDVQMATLQAVPERYARLHRPPAPPTLSLVDSARYMDVNPATQGLRSIVNLVGYYALPEDFISDVAVGLTYDNQLWAARKMSRRDLYTVLTKAFTKPTRRDPVFCIDKILGETSPRLYISSGAALPGAGEVEVWYLARLPWLQIFPPPGVSNAEVRIGYDLQELVVLVACLRILETVSGAEARVLIRQDVEMAVMAMERQYEGAVDRSRLLVEARESTVPSQPTVDANARGM